ncbi:PREDICTED: LON peptidase N-terminal domain and RING finger protein 2 [Propithecus coquereli]|uniref:LON peptidase N-terminal domain and ring finger 2 n=1 Tax=Propithecus coquereli TaxID=379532 RepID=A0A2K6FHQ1_PROCO|nr:PREDICTED: LON peptidase N-terminal domain and RING finger protein 2 [Propithecus coquereli]
MSPEPVPPPPPPQRPGCDRGEPFAQRLEKGDEAFREGEYETAAEIFRSMLAGLAQPDRGLCLRLGDALARAGRLPEALGAFRGAARLGALRPEELGELAGGLARAVGLREWRLSAGKPGCTPEAPSDGHPVSASAAPRDLLGCPRCRRLLHKPVTLPCGLTVCKRCVEPGPTWPQPRRVNVVLSGLLEKCFPAECRLRRLAGQARSLQRQQQPETALLRCDQALDLAPDDNSLLLLRAELYLTVKNYEQALQDASAVCQNEPLLTKGHHLKAQALSGLGRSKEVLKEFLYCLALNPECNSVKKEAQKVMCEVLFPASENVHQNLTSSIQSKLQAQCQSHGNTQSTLEGGGDAGSSELLASRNFNITVLAEELIFRYLSDELSDRKRIYDEEMTELSNLTRDVPIFVCAMAFPTVPCPLHVFEPRYRLMIRRCMETGTKRFGMCLSAEHAGISEYGCMLEIKDVRTFPDGSSVVDAVGISRFRVLSHRHRDGYNTADIEYIEDEKVEGPGYEELTTLHDSVYQQSVSWFASLQDHMKEQILSHFGLMPDREPEPQSNPSGPAWSWWILAVLPLERKAQLAILGMTSLKERLLAIRRILVIITRKMNSRQELANTRERNN